MKRSIVLTILILICFVLQCTVFRSLSFNGIIPNLLIVLTSSFGFMRGERAGLIVGFFCGLLSDIFFGNILGFYALIYMYIGFVNGKFCRIFYPEDIKLPIALIVVSDLTYGIICYLLQFLLRGRFEFTYYFTHVILPETVYTIIVTMLLYPLVLKINERLDGRRKRGEQDFV